MRSTNVTFLNQEGTQLFGKLDLPLDRQVSHFAILVHCFACGKAISAARNISLALVQNGFGVLHFDFSGAENANEDDPSKFVADLKNIRAAADFLSEKYRAPSLMIGHSLGGTAALMAVAEIQSVKAIVAIGAPSEPQPVSALAEVGGASDVAVLHLEEKDIHVRKSFLEKITSDGLKDLLHKMRDKALLVMHSPQDSVVNISNARFIYEAAFHPKSFISLDGADHLLSDVKDSYYAGNMIASWVQRYLVFPLEKQMKSDEQVIARLEEGPFLTQILAGHHHLLADEPEEAGGEDLGPSPYELLSAGLGACTAMTIKMYANHKKWDIGEVEVYLDYDSNYIQDCENCNDDQRKIGKFKRVIVISGQLTEDQRQRILRVANKCPVHKTLRQGVEVETLLK